MESDGDRAQKCDPDAAAAPTRTGGGGQRRGHGALVARLSRYSMMHIMPTSFTRRSGSRGQPEVTDPTSVDAPERGSLTPAMRKKYLKDVLLSHTSGIGFGGVLSVETASRRGSGCCASPRRDAQQLDPQRADFVLDPQEHAWMLCAVDGNDEAIFGMIADDPCLVNRKDFVSGYSVLHWLAKRGNGETLVRLLRHAETAGIPADVNARGSGGLTPLHVASMHGQYMVIQHLVGAFGADVDVMDYGGRRAWQYLKGDAPPAIQELLGTWDEQRNDNNNACSTSQSADVVDDEVDPPERTGAGSWGLKYFRDLLPSFNLFRNKC
ncbi:unnamed protein product [Merluccius merluccius]